MSNGNLEKYELYQKALASKLRDMRLSRGWTFRETAKNTGLGVRHIVYLESAERVPNLGTLLKYADAFGVTFVLNPEHDIEVLDNA